MSFIPLAITGASVLGSLVNSLLGPRNPFDADDIKRYLQLEQSRVLAENALATRRRLASAGLGGSGVVNSVISDQASRIRSQFEEQWQKMLLQLKQSQYERALQQQQSRAGLFGNLASLGFSLYQLGQPSPFADLLKQLQELQKQQGFTGQEINQLNVSELFNPQFQRLPAQNYNYQLDQPGFQSPRLS